MASELLAEVRFPHQQGQRGELRWGLQRPGEPQGSASGSQGPTGFR